MPDPIQNVRDGLTSFLDVVFDYSKEQIFAQPIPILGADLSGVADPALQFLQDLGQTIEDAIDGIGAGTGMPAQDLVAALDAVDGIDAEISGAMGSEIVTIAMTGTDAVALDPLAVAADLGLPGLELAFDGDPELTPDLIYTYDFTFEYDVATSDFVFIEDGANDLRFDLSGSLDLTTTAMLGFLGLNVIDTNADPELAVGFATDIAAVDLSLFSDADLTTAIEGGAEVTFDLETMAPSIFIPELVATFALEWAFDGTELGASLAEFGDQPLIDFTDIELRLAPFFDFLDTIFGQIVDVVTPFPVGELIDVLTKVLPVVDDLGRSFLDVVPPEGVTLVDIVQLLLGDKADLSFIGALAAIDDISDAIEALGDLTTIELGDVALLADARTTDPVLVPFDFTPNSDLADTFDDLVGDLFDGLGEGVAAFGLPLLEDPSLALNLLLNPYSDEGIPLVEYDIPELGFEALFSQFFPIVGPIGAVLEGSIGAGIDFLVGFQIPPGGLEELSFEDAFFLGASAEEPVATITAGIAAGAGLNAYVLKASVTGGVASSIGASVNDVDSNGVGDNDGRSPIGPLFESGCIFDPITGEVTAGLGVRITIGFGPFSFSRFFELFQAVLANFEIGCEGQSGAGAEANRGLATFEEDDVGDGILRLNAGPTFAQFRLVNDTPGTDVNEAYVIRPPEGAVAGPLPIPFPILNVMGFGLEEAFGSEDDPVEQIVGEMGEADDSVFLDPLLTQRLILTAGPGFDQIYGAAGDDSIEGDADEDFLSGGEGDDTLRGGTENDVLEGGPGADLLDGGEGRDQVLYEESPVGIVFTPAEENGEMVFLGTGGDAEGDRLISIEYIIGTAFSDVLQGNPDDENTLEGLEGADILIGGDSPDYILGGPGPDLMVGGGNDGGLDATAYITSYGGVQINLATGFASGGDAQGDQVFEFEAVQGSGFDDVLIGTAGTNILGGAFADDILLGNGGRDLVEGGIGDDTVFGDQDGNGDWLDGGGDLFDSPGQDLLTYRTASGPVSVDLIEDGRLEIPEAFPFESLGGNDLVRLSHQPDEDDPEFGFSTFEQLEGSPFPDTLAGDAADNVIRGLAGNDAIDGRRGDDTLVGGAAGDTLDGGPGFDEADYRESPGGVTADLTAGSGMGGDAEGDEYTTIEDLRGSQRDDLLIGNAGSNRIDPGLGADFVVGLEGFDHLFVDYTNRDNPGNGGLMGGVASGFDDSGLFQRAFGVSSMDEVLFTGMEALTIIGTSKDDEIFTGPFADFVIGGGGDDSLWGGLGINRLLAGDGDDFVVTHNNIHRQFDTLETVDPLLILPLFFTFGFQQLDGGDGIDALAFNGQFAPFAFDIAFGDGDVENPDQLLILPNNTVIANFEQLFRIHTSIFQDSLGQTGRTTNLFATSLSDDVIAPGLGVDVVDGGRTFFIPLSPDTGTGAPPPSLPPLGQEFGTEVEGDLLILDYRELDDGSPVVGNVVPVFDVTVAPPLITTNGTYARGPDLVTFFNIERLMVDGGSGDDLLVGAFGDAPPRGNDVLRAHAGDDIVFGVSGDDELRGGEGDDIVVGGQHDDALSGGPGDDFLVGTALPGNPALPPPGQGEVDRLEGGAGADGFFLGLPGFVFYDDGDPLASGDDRAVLLDFDPDEGDLIGLDGTADDYRSFTVGSTTSIFLKTGPAGIFSELIAELQNVEDFDLEAAYVVYSEDDGAPDDIFGTIGALPPPGDGGGGFVALAESLGLVLPPAEQTAAMLAELGTASPPAAPALPTQLDDIIVAPDDEPWVEPITDLSQFSDALMIDGLPPGPGFFFNIETDGDARAFGVFEDDPFGLGSGLVISTGQAVDLPGVNEIDGGIGPIRDFPLEFVPIGTFEDATIFRAEIDNFGFDIQSFTLTDGLSFGGGSEANSGFDLDAIAISPVRLPDTIGLDLNDMADLPRFDVFDFSPAGTIVTPGRLRLNADDVPDTRNLKGSVNGLVNDAFATLGTFDFVDLVANEDETGFVSFGDGGSVGFNLTQPLSSAGRPYYLYVAEAGAPETLTGTISASNGPIGGVGDLSTDFGLPGPAGDTIALTLQVGFFDSGDVDPPSLAGKTLEFDFAVLSEEMAEYAGTLPQDSVKIEWNGVNLAQLNDGAALTMNNLSPSPLGPRHPDFVYNPVGTGPASDETRADGYTQRLTFRGPMIDGINTLRIEVADVRDGGLDTALLIVGGSLRVITNAGLSFVPVAGGDRLAVSEDGKRDELRIALELQEGDQPAGDVVVTLDPDTELDLGNGPGEAVTITLGQPLSEIVQVAAAGDRDVEGQHIGTIQVQIRSSDPRFDGLAIAPIIVDIGERTIPAIVGTAGDDVLFGDRIGRADDDLIFGDAGNDRIFGLAANDDIRGEEGDDLLLGGPGNDILIGGPGDDRLFGNLGDDVLDGGEGSNALFGGPGDDHLRSSLVGTTELRGDTGDDELAIGFGDGLAGRRPSLAVFGGPGDDAMRIVSSQTGVPVLAFAPGELNEPYVIGSLWNGGTGNDTAELEREFLLTSSDADVAGADLSVREDSTVDLGPGSDHLENILTLRVEPGEASFAGMHFVSSATHRLGTDDDSLFERFDYATGASEAGEIGLEELTIVHEGIVHMGTGDDRAEVDDRIAIGTSDDHRDEPPPPEPVDAQRFSFGLERTFFGGPGDDGLLDTSALVIDTAGQTPGQTVRVTHEVTHTLQAGGDHVEDRSAVHVFQRNETNLELLHARAFDGGPGNDTLIMSGAIVVSVEDGASPDALSSRVSLGLTYEGGPGHDAFLFNPTEFSISKTVPFDRHGGGTDVGVDVAFFGGAGRDTFVVHTDVLLAGRQSEGSLAPNILVHGGADVDTVAFRGGAAVAIDLAAEVAIVGADLGDDAIAIRLIQIEGATADALFA